MISIKLLRKLLNISKALIYQTLLWRSLREVYNMFEALKSEVQKTSSAQNTEVSTNLLVWTFCGNSPETLTKLRVSKNFPRHEIR